MTGFVIPKNPFLESANDANTKPPSGNVPSTDISGKSSIL
jgi:hypothetical protein